MPRDWFWQLATAGQGPDFLCFVEFAPADAARLAALVHAQPLPGFGYQRLSAAPCLSHGQRHSHDHYGDAPLATAADDPPHNRWIYHAIEVCGHALTIARGYGGYPGAHGQTETALLLRLAQEPGLTLGTWRVAYGGDGYAGGTLAGSTGGAALAAYLAEPVS